MTFLFLEETVKHRVPMWQLIKGRRDAKVIVLDGPLPEDTEDIPAAEKPLPLRSLLTRRVIISAANYACLSLIDIFFRAVQPVFYSTPIEFGGLGLSPAKIGNVLSALGLLSGVFQMFFFARIHDKLGSRVTFFIGIVAGLPVFAAFPVMNYLARTEGYSFTLWAVVAIQIVISILMGLSYG